MGLWIPWRGFESFPASSENSQLLMYEPNVSSFLFIDLFSLPTVKIINELYNLDADSPTAISLYYQQVIKKSLWANEVDVIEDLIKNQGEQSIQKIQILLNEINSKVELIDNFLSYILEDNHLEDEQVREEVNQTNTLKNTLSSVINKISFESDQIYIYKGEEKLNLIENNEFWNLISSSFNQLKLATWNIYNSLKLDVKPYFLETKIDFLRRIKQPIFIDYFLSDYLNFKTVDKEFIEWLFLDLELEILSSIEYLQKEELFYLRESTSEIISQIISNLENFEKIQDLYVDMRYVYDYILTLKMNFALFCPDCGLALNNNACQNCNIVFVDLETKVPFIRNLFQAVLLKDFDLFIQLLDLSIVGLTKVSLKEDDKFYSILDNIKFDQNIPLYFKAKLGSVEILDRIVEKLEKLKKGDITNLSLVSDLLYDINNDIEKIMVLTM